VRSGGGFLGRNTFKEGKGKSPGLTQNLFVGPIASQKESEDTPSTSNEKTTHQRRRGDLSKKKKGRGGEGNKRRVTKSVWFCAIRGMEKTYG